jgi:hypothetical protein
VDRRLVRNALGQWLKTKAARSPAYIALTIEDERGGATVGSVVGPASTTR